MGISSQAKGTTMASSDSHVTIVPYFTVPEGKMDAFKAGFADFYKHTTEGTAASGECLYYGFAQEGNKIFCREGYKSADGVLAHLGEVKAELDIAVGLVGEGGLDLSVMGPRQSWRSSRDPWVLSEPNFSPSTKVQS